ncbi:MAG: hypothetical protein FWF25_02830 [Propionibacteriaceae bacterium]|nr:hypothetical protein [Propionibacteriaceae bacterium]
MTSPTKKKTPVPTDHKAEKGHVNYDGVTWKFDPDDMDDVEFIKIADDPARFDDVLKFMFQDQYDKVVKVLRADPKRVSNRGGLRITECQAWVRGFLEAVAPNS